MPKKNSECDECGETPARINRIFDKRLCKECRENPEYKLIYKTTAKNKYFLNEKDIEQLECFETVAYTGYGNRSAVTLIRDYDAMMYFCHKQGIDVSQVEERRELLQERKERKSEKIKATKKEKKNNREKELKKALKKKGVEMRNDSKLCRGYIDGTIKDWSVKEIVKRMCQMKYLYEYANMDRYIAKVERNQMKELKAGYFPDTSVVEEAEMMALKKAGGFPKKWPWLEEE